MKRFKLEHYRQRKYKAMLFMFMVLLTMFVYFDYGRPTGFIANIEQEDNGILYNALKNEQVRLFVNNHDYSVAFRELDYIELALAKERKPDIYRSLEGKFYEVEFISDNARIIAILNYDGNVVKVYNPNIE